jgi:hypothetical protein
MKYRQDVARPKSLFVSNIMNSVNEDCSRILRVGETNTDTQLIPTQIYLQPHSALCYVYRQKLHSLCYRYMNLFATTDKDDPDGEPKQC